MNMTKYTCATYLVPSEFYLSQNYPNPFSERTTIKLCVAYKTRVKLQVFTSEGKMIETLLDEEKEAGTYEIEFHPASLPGSGLRPSHVIYVYKLEAGDFSATKEMLVLKLSLT